MSIADPREWTSTKYGDPAQLVKLALGFGTPEEQVVAATILTAFIIATSWVTGFVTLVFALFTAVLLLIGVVRVIIEKVGEAV